MRGPRDERPLTVCYVPGIVKIGFSNLFAVPAAWDGETRHLGRVMVSLRACRCPAAPLCSLFHSPVQTAEDCGPDAYRAQ